MDYFSWRTLFVELVILEVVVLGQRLGRIPHLPVFEARYRLIRWIEKRVVRRRRLFLFLSPFPFLGREGDFPPHLPSLFVELYQVLAMLFIRHSSYQANI